MATALVFSVSTAGQVGAHTISEPTVALTRPQACLRRSVASQVVSCRWLPSSSFTGVCLERHRYIANRHSETLKDNYGHLLPIKAEGNSGSNEFNKLEVVENEFKKANSALEDQFQRFAKAILLQDEKLAEQVIDEMGSFGDTVLEEQYERFKKAMAENDNEAAEQIMKELGYTDDGAVEDQFNRFAKSLLIDGGLMGEQGEQREQREQSEQGTKEMGGSQESPLEDQFNRFTRALQSNDDGTAEQVLKEMGHSVDYNDMKGLVSEVSGMQEQLQELTDQVLKLVEEGDAEGALGLIDANLEVLSEQLESGYRGMEQVAMLDTLASLKMSMGEFEETETLLDQIKDLMEDIGIDSLQPLADRVLEHTGSMYTELGKPEEGLPLILKSLEIQEDLVGAESPLITDTLLELATCYNDMDDSTNAIEVYNRIIAIIEKTRGPADTSLALPLSKLGQCLLEVERLNEAESALQRAIELVEKAYGTKDGRYGIAKCALARVYASGGSVDDAIALSEEGIQVMESCSNLEEDDSSLETARADLAELLSLVGRNEEAEELWETNLVVRERLVGPDHPTLVVHLQNLATAYAVGEKHEKALPLLRRTLKLAVEDLGPDAPQVSVPLEMLATALHHLDRPAEAEPIARRALEIREAHFDPDSAVIGEACNCLASILHAVGKYEEALPLMQRVLSIQEKELGPNSPQLVLSLELIIMLLDRSGRAEEIEPYYKRLALLATEDDDLMEEIDEEEVDGEYDGEEDDSILNEIRARFDTRPAPASNMYVDEDDGDIIDI